MSHQKHPSAGVVVDGLALLEMDSRDGTGPTSWAPEARLCLFAGHDLENPDNHLDDGGKAVEDYIYQCKAEDGTWINRASDQSRRCGGPQHRTFQIDGDSLLLVSTGTEDIDYEQWSELTVVVRAQDEKGTIIGDEQTITIPVKDVNELPTQLQYVPLLSSIPEDTEPDTIIGAFKIYMTRICCL